MIELMNYQVLARKWRPNYFSEVIGQKYVIIALMNSLKLGRLHHSYLFSGTRGVGKTTIARLFAKGLNCLHFNEEPCGKCIHCNEIKKGNFIDLIEIDAASRTKVEDIRELLDNIQYPPMCGRYKIYLIDEVHMLSRHSFHALLKTLEEPPNHVKFLLATTDFHKIPLTILSRCLHFNLKILEVNQILNQLKLILKKENIDFQPQALLLIAQAANGSMRDALSLTDQAIVLGNNKNITLDMVNLMLGTLDEKTPLTLLELITHGDGEKIIKCLNNIARKSFIDWEKILLEMLIILHKITISQWVPNKCSSTVFENDIYLNEDRIKKLSNHLSPEDIHLYYQILLMGRKELLLVPDKKIGVEMTLLKLIAFNSQQKVYNNINR